MVPVLFAAGYINHDITALVDRLPESGGRITAASITRSSGGMTANLACAAAKLGLSVSFFGQVGLDAIGNSAIQELEQFGVNTQWILRTDRPTTTALILLDKTGERTIISEPIELNYQLLETALETANYSSPKCLHFDGYQFPRAIDLLQKAKQFGFLTSADLDGIEPEEISAIAPQVAPYLDVIFLNRRISQGIDSNPQFVVGQLQQFGAKIVALTLGKDGALIATSDHVTSLPALSDAVVLDTTGAGDVFAGAFLAAWLTGETAVSSGQFAIVASGISLDSNGARGHLPNRKEVLQKLQTI